MIYRFSDFHNNWVVLIRASSQMMAKEKLHRHLTAMNRTDLIDICNEGGEIMADVVFSTLDPSNHPTKLEPEKVPVGACAVPSNLNIFSE